MVRDSRWLYFVLVGVFCFSLGVTAVGTPVQGAMAINRVQTNTSCLTYLKIAPYKPAHRTVFNTRSRLGSALFPAVSLPHNPYQMAMCYSGPISHTRSAAAVLEPDRVRPKYHLNTSPSIPKATPVQILTSNGGHSANNRTALNRYQTRQTNDETLGPRTQLLGSPSSQSNPFKRDNPSIAPLSSILRRKEHDDEVTLSILLSYLRSNYVRFLPAVT